MIDVDRDVKSERNRKQRKRDEEKGRESEKFT